MEGSLIRLIAKYLSNEKSPMHFNKVESLE